MWNDLIADPFNLKYGADADEVLKIKVFAANEMGASTNSADGVLSMQREPSPP